jgi:ATPase subunit of ABC transporter with duplicated ATPase domains
MPNTTPSQDFLNAVCTHTMWLANGTIKYYGGNYAKFVATVEEEERLQLRYLPLMTTDCLPNWRRLKRRSDSSSGTSR